MQDLLTGKLHQYIKENNPDLLIQLEEEKKVTAYLADKVKLTEPLLQQSEGQPAYILEEACMDMLTKDLRPSKFNYIREILEEDFTMEYKQMEQNGILQFEVINLVNHCQPVFEEFSFSEGNENNRHLQYCITGAISEYSEHISEFEKVRHGIQQPAKITG